MAVLEYPIRILLVTISDVDDYNKVKNELNKHGKVIGTVFTVGKNGADVNKVKGGGYLWKHKKPGKDEFFLIVLAAIPKASEVLEKGLKAISSRGLFNLKKFHEEYPVIPVHDIGVIINAQEIEKAGKKYGTKQKKIEQVGWHDIGELKSLIKKLDKKKDKTKKDKDQLEDYKAELKLQESINRLSGMRTRELKLGCVIIEDDDDFTKIYKELIPHAGKTLRGREIWAGRFAKEDVGLMIWHHEQFGQDEYWALLFLDKDTIKSGKLADWEGPAINEFKKLYQNVIPIIEIPKIKTGVSIDAGKIISRLERAQKKIKKDKDLKEAKIKI